VKNPNTVFVLFQFPENIPAQYKTFRIVLKLILVKTFVLNF